MRSTLKSAVAGTLCAALTATALPSEAWAGPTGAASASVVGLSSPVENVRYYRHHRRHHHYWARHHYYRYGYPYYRYGYDPGAALFGAAALSLLSAPAWGWGWGHPYGYGYGWGYPYGYGWGWGPRFGWW